MDSNDYKYFSMLVKELNINRAAQKLFISPQALSKRIINLEEYYQVKLFERKPTLRLTYAGKRLLEYYEKLASLETHAKAELLEIANGKRGELKIGISSSRVAQMISLTFPEFYQKYPDVCVHILAGHTTTLLQNLIDGDVDFTIATSTLTSHEVQGIDLASESIKLFISDSLLKEACPEHYSLLVEAERASVPVSIEEFRNCPFILSLPGNRIHTAISRACASKKMVIRNILSVDNYDLRMRLAKKGYGATLFTTPTHRISNNLQGSNQELYQFSISEFPPPESLKISYLTNRYMPQYTKDFIDLIVRYYPPTL